jgi:hypothetical protein
MYRVYLDWNVISNLKRIDVEKFSQLRLLIAENQDRLLIPFTTAHIEDLKKSLKPGMSDDLLLKDLDLLSEISKNEFINWTKNNNTEPFIGEPNAFYYENKEEWINQDSNDISNIFTSLTSTFIDTELNSFGETFINTLKSLSLGDFFPKNEINKTFNITSDYNNMWEYLNVFAEVMNGMLNKKEDYLKLRDNTQNNGLLGISKNSANWEDEKVFDNIDEILKSLGIHQTTMELSDFAVKQFKKDKATIYDGFTTLYLCLDLIGYKSDKLSKPMNTMTNITNDGLHSFYGAHCEYIVTDDKNLARKSKAIYHKLEIPTKVLSTSEFVESFNEIVPRKYNHLSDFISDLVYILSPANFIEENDFDNGLKANIFKIPYLAFDFFNFAIQTYYPDYNTTEIVFRRAFKNYSRFIFHREVDSLIAYVLTVCGYEITDAITTYVRNTVIKEDGIFLLIDADFYKIAIANDDYKIKLVLMIDHEKADKHIEKQ